MAERPAKARVHARMAATELKAVRHLERGDLLQLGNDPRFYRVGEIDRPPDELADARFRVGLQAIDGPARVTLVRTGREQVLMVARGGHSP